MMHLVFADKGYPAAVTKSIFLAGPSPRSRAQIDWRPQALAHLVRAGFDGTVFIPAPEDTFYGRGAPEKWSYDQQIVWECRSRQMADLIVFWVPRDIAGGMPAFTTNIEFGEDLSSGKILYGRPDNAEKCRYLDERFRGQPHPIFTDLGQLLDKAISLLGAGATRINGEVNVPLFIWDSDQFQSWYKSLLTAGNRLDGCRVLHSVQLPDGLFCYTIGVCIWIAAEGRHKSNEIVFARRDISAVLAYYKDKDDTHVLLARDVFRT